MSRLITPGNWLPLLVLLGPLSGMAVADWHAEGPKKVIQINTGWAGEGFHVYTDTPSAICGGPAYWMPKSSSPMFQENLSILLSALHANARVTMVFETCGTDGYPLLKAVNIAP